MSLNLTECFSTWKYAYYPGTCQPISRLRNTYIIMEIGYMFLNLVMAYYLGSCVSIFYRKNTNPT